MTDMNLTAVLQKEFNLKENHINNIIKLIDDGNTIPFIARYRKELTGSVDDQLLRALYERLTYLRNLNVERERIIEAIRESGQLNDELLKKLNSAETLSKLEDLYLPYRPKRKTRGSVARAQGLEPLAEIILSQDKSKSEIFSAANEFINDEVLDSEAAIKGAMDIIAEDISFDAELRSRLKNVIGTYGTIQSAACREDTEDSIYAMYANHSESIKKVPNHRILAMNRGEKEGYLKISIDYEKTQIYGIVKKEYLKPNGIFTDYVEAAAEDAYSRLIFPAIERELRNTLTERAVTAAITVFANNLKSLLMQPPLKSRTVMGLDPGYRTGCKVAVVDPTGKVLDTGVIYPAPPHNKIQDAEKTLINFIKKHNVQAVAIGNGTASHETEEFYAQINEKNRLNIGYMVVSEAGASVYSASKLGAEEFPQFDVSLRSAVSIARRLQDPLSELVKIDPQAIGVGQYQHDMPKKQLEKSLDGVVEQCVNAVGVDLNTASASLLKRVAGITAAIAENIVQYREEFGEFKTRKELLKVKKLGAKAYEQCAGFLRIRNGSQPLDNTGVHPESYKAAEQLLKLSKSAGKVKEYLESANKSEIAKMLCIGLPTLTDIAEELSRPGRDPREDLPAPMLKKNLLSIENLKEEMILSGTVRNVIDFGAFVDIGVHEDGLIHISEISDQFIRHPSEVLKVGDIIKVRVLSVDVKKKRIALSRKGIEG